MVITREELVEFVNLMDSAIREGADAVSRATEGIDSETWEDLNAPYNEEGTALEAHSRVWNLQRRLAAGEPLQDES